MSTESVTSSTTHPLYKEKTTTTTTSAADDMQTRFLTLLTTQLKNQDPLNPTDANQMTAQLSQISTVSGIEKLNTTMEKLLSSYSAVQNMQAAAMIGKTVFIAGNEMELGSEGAIAGFNLESAAESVTVKIRDSDGNLVTTQDIGAMPTGIGSFYWDGTKADGTKATEGTYNFTFEATKGTTKVKGESLQAGTISAVTMLSSGAALVLNGKKNVSYTDIRQILN